jgi:hypothetical protein
MTSLIPNVDIVGRICQLTERAQYLGDVSFVSGRLGFLGRGLIHAGLEGSSVFQIVDGLIKDQIALSQAENELRKMGPSYLPLTHFSEVVEKGGTIPAHALEILEDEGLGIGLRDEYEQRILSGPLQTWSTLRPQGNNLLRFSPPSNYSFAPESRQEDRAKKAVEERIRTKRFAEEIHRLFGIEPRKPRKLVGRSVFKAALSVIDEMLKAEGWDTQWTGRELLINSGNYGLELLFDLTDDFPSADAILANILDVYFRSPLWTFFHSVDDEEIRRPYIRITDNRKRFLEEQGKQREERAGHLAFESCPLNQPDVAVVTSLSLFALMFRAEAQWKWKVVNHIQRHVGTDIETKMLRLSEYMGLGLTNFPLPERDPPHTEQRWREFLERATDLEIYIHAGGGMHLSETNLSYLMNVVGPWQIQAANELFMDSLNPIWVGGLGFDLTDMYKCGYIKT